MLITIINEGAEKSHEYSNREFMHLLLEEYNSGNMEIVSPSFTSNSEFSEFCFEKKHVGLPSYYKFQTNDSNAKAFIEYGNMLNKVERSKFKPFKVRVTRAVDWLKSEIKSQVADQQKPSIEQASIDYNPIKSHNAFNSYFQAVNDAFVERSQEVAIIRNALISGQNIAFIGLPGTGKSAIITAISNSINSPSGDFKKFQYLISKTTTPEELLGQWSLKEMKADRMVRKYENKLGDCKFAFLDEVFKCNSATLNSLLTILNERQLDIGDGVRINVPLELVIGASNEYPTDKTLQALWDRWVFRYEVLPVQSEHGFARMFQDENLGVVQAELNWKDVLQIRKKAQAIVIDDGVMAVLQELRAQLMAKKIAPSMRKWRKCATILTAEAAINNRSRIEREDFAILSHVLWDLPQQAKIVWQIINDLPQIVRHNPADKFQVGFLTEATNAIHFWNKMSQDEALATGIHRFSALIEKFRDQYSVELKGLEGCEPSHLAELNNCVLEMRKAIRTKFGR